MRMGTGFGVGALAATFVLGLACSDGSGPRIAATAASSSGDAPGGGGSTGAGEGGGGGSSGGSACPESFAQVEIPGVAYDPAQDCVDSSVSELLQVCTNFESAPLYIYQCQRRLSDGREYWLNSATKLTPPVGWEHCDAATIHQEVKPPRPCFALGCPETNEFGGPGTVESTCTPDATKAMLGCGQPNYYGHETYWDEDCCHRRSCESDGDCAAGQECRVITADHYIYCWVSKPQEEPFDPEACACGGSLGGPSAGWCFTSRR
jgi:hypothetical protein